MDRPRPPAPPSPAPLTTFVHADRSTFKDLVQRLTGQSAAEQRPAAPRPPPSPTTGVRRPAFKPAQHRPNLTIVKPPPRAAGGFLSPSLPDLAGQLRIWEKDAAPPSSAAAVVINEAEEERAIREKRFYLHPSPRSAAAAPASAGEPELLPLFPLASPKNSSRED